MTDDRTQLARDVHVPISDRDVDETWRRLDATLRPERSPARWFVLAGVSLAAVAALVVAVQLQRDNPALSSGAPLTTASVGHLEEGSTVVVAEATSGELEAVSADEVRVRLDRGVMRFDVAKKPGRRFSVVAGRVEVRVVGTRFVVRREQRASVSVERGVVEVWVEGTKRAVLEAGDTWEEPALAVVAEDPQPVAPSSVPEALELPADPRPPKRKAPKGVRTQPVAAQPPTAPPVPEVDDASAVFKLALEARRAGRAAEAAQTLSTFVTKFPDDARAGLALFELGRLQMDQLHTPTRAVESLERAVAKASSGTYLEDAMARLVRLHHELHRPSACESARRAYLERFPTGLHAATLSALCTN